MEVEFCKTGPRRYSVAVYRDNLPVLKIDPAPGYDPFMPHDMMHFIVEQEFGLKKAIYGQLAKGGTAGSFRIEIQEAHSRNASRERRSAKRQGKKMLGMGTDEFGQSERATFICWQDWVHHSSDPKLKEKALEMRESALSILGLMAESERKWYSPEKLALVRKRMDEVSSQWAKLKINETLRLKW